jgi:hypothetical protein
LDHITQPRPKTSVHPDLTQEGAVLDGNDTSLDGIVMPTTPPMTIPDPFMASHTPCYWACELGNHILMLKEAVQGLSKRRTDVEQEADGHRFQSSSTLDL